jgi:hypothetical protein
MTAQKGRVMQNALLPSAQRSARPLALASTVTSDSRRNNLGPSVPFVTLWSGEQAGAMRVVWRRRGRRIGYADERSYDRDERGVLWSRVASRPGRGRPMFGQIHSRRQRIAMAQLLCQVCGGPADRSDAGVLWLIDADSRELLPHAEETAHPPVCRPCALSSVRVCPHLRSAVTAVRVRSFAPSRVNAVVYGLTPSGPRAVDTALVAFGSPLMPYVRAHQLLMRLADFNPVDLADPDS